MKSATYYKNHLKTLQHGLRTCQPQNIDTYKNGIKFAQKKIKELTK